VRTLALPQMGADGVAGAGDVALAFTEDAAAPATTIAITMDKAPTRFRLLLRIDTQPCRRNHSCGTHTVRPLTLVPILE
jgi:hypothetical protein